MKQIGPVRVGLKPRYPQRRSMPQKDTTIANMGARRYPLCAACHRLRVSAPTDTLCRICTRRRT